MSIMFDDGVVKAYPKLHSVMIEILKIKDLTAGKQFSKEHEKAVSERLTHKFIKNERLTSSQSTGIKSIEDWQNNGMDIDILNDGAFVAHPFGDNRHPDLVVRENNRIFWLECKTSTKGKSFSFNSTIPTHETIYILSTTDRTKLSFGFRLISKKAIQCYIERKSKKTPTVTIDGWTFRDRSMSNRSSKSINEFYKTTKEVMQFLIDGIDVTNPHKDEKDSSNPSLLKFLS